MGQGCGGYHGQGRRCELTENHWEVINFLREYYEEYQIAPAVRVLTKAIGKKLGKDKGNSKYLYELFPYGPAKQACKIRRPAEADRLRLTQQAEVCRGPHPLQRFLIRHPHCYRSPDSMPFWTIVYALAVLYRHRPADRGPGCTGSGSMRQHRHH